MYVKIFLHNHRKCQKAHSGIVSGRQGPGQARTLARRRYKKTVWILFQIHIHTVTSRSIFYYLSPPQCQNKQMNPESIDRIEHSTYTPLEKK